MTIINNGVDQGRYFRVGMRWAETEYNTVSGYMFRVFQKVLAFYCSRWPDFHLPLGEGTEEPLGHPLTVVPPPPNNDNGKVNVEVAASPASHTPATSTETCVSTECSGNQRTVQKATKIGHAYPQSKAAVSFTIPYGSLKFERHDSCV
ncbi:hypothetical protein EMCG_06607 [[Emmonsia] crescens]|uniref:Uncharacterized protein n=1 Tax=[Emmonsia] crescens TaxID=73230 RepID=A0A0G2IBS5_9EURO|nr:hypothetical protein EMCG_06607 [Emmonsia crescens UAMH 3008]